MTTRVVRRVAIGFAFALGGAGALLLGANGLFAAESGGGPVAEMQIYPTQVVWTPVVPHDSIKLNISGPGDLNGSATFEAGSAPTFLAASNPAGRYTYELVVMPSISSSVKRRMEAATDPDEREALFRELRASGQIPATVLTQSGGFTIDGGSVVGSSSTITSGDQDGPTTRQVIAEDLIVQGSLCVGFDCVNGESFGFDTLRLKENNTRIKFDDTSASGGFPANDWQLTANDSASGGLNKFSIEDITGAKVPFTVEAGASTNSLYVDSTSRIGLRTATPVLDVHVSTPNTPGLRLEQNTGGGFTAQTWDIAGNEANFFVRDVTGGSKLPFRIRPGAATSSIDISAAGDVGMGFATAPAAQLEVRSDTDDVAKFTNQSDQTSAVQISVAQGTPDEPKVEFITPDGTWSVGIDGATNHMVFQNASTDLMSIDHKTREVVFAGGVTANGGIMHASDADRKEEFVNVDTEDLLDQALDLRIASWQYKNDATGARHIGPTAQDFAERFKVGSDDKFINTIDADGVALGAIQGLNARLLKALDERDARIAELEARITALEANK